MSETFEENKAAGGNFGMADSNGPGQSGAAIANEISQRTGKPKRAYKRSGAFSRNADPNSQLGNPENSDGNGSRPEPVVSPDVAAEIFAKSVCAAVKSGSKFIINHIKNRLEKLGIEKDECILLSKDAEYSEENLLLLHEQLKCLALKYAVLRDFGPEILISLNLGSYIWQLVTVNAALNRIEKRLAEKVAVPAQNQTT